MQCDIVVTSRRHLCNIIVASLVLLSFTFAFCCTFASCCTFFWTFWGHVMTECDVSVTSLWQQWHHYPSLCFPVHVFASCCTFWTFGVMGGCMVTSQEWNALFCNVWVELLFDCIPRNNCLFGNVLFIGIIWFIGGPPTAGKVLISMQGEKWKVWIRNDKCSEIRRLHKMQDFPDVRRNPVPYDFVDFLDPTPKIKQYKEKGNRMDKEKVGPARQKMGKVQSLG